MNPRTEKALQRWVTAGVLDAQSAERIRAFEGEREKSGGLRWPVLLAISLGGLLLGAGLLLFVTASWDDLSPALQFTAVLLLVGVFHLAGAFIADRFSALATVLHAVGTLSCGAGVFLAAEIFQMAEHWPAGIMMWAAGAWMGWLFLRDWPHALLVAFLTPVWLASEWGVATEHFVGAQKIQMQGLLLLSITYLTARTAEQDSPIRRALVWLGGIALIPCTIMTRANFLWPDRPALPAVHAWLGYAVALSVPILLAYLFRKRAAWENLLAALWVVVLGALASPSVTGKELFRLGEYAWLELGAVGLTWWGLKRGRKGLVNLGVAAFALVVVDFYFSSVLGRLGRSLSMIGLGFLFLVGGWALERVRRRLIARMSEGAK